MCVKMSYLEDILWVFTQLTPSQDKHPQEKHKVPKIMLIM